MRERRIWVFLIIALAALQAGYFQCLASDAKAPKITKEELKSMLGNSDVTIIDVRLDIDWEKSASKIKGAAREDPEGDVQAWAEKYSKGKTIVFY